MQVEIWSDVMCPWCAVGKARFEAALADFPHADDVDIVWRSFELDPNAPQEKEGDYAELLAAKYNSSVEDAQAMVDRMTATAAEVGLDFRFDRVRPGNTFDAHRLLHLAAERGLQHQVKDRFLTAYLTEGEAVGTSEVLQRIATEAGLDEVEVKEVLASDAYADAVRGDEQTAAELGIRGVPFFVFDRTFALSGAQPTEVMRRALDQAWQSSNPLTVLGGEPGEHDHGEGCTDGSCSI